MSLKNPQEPVPIPRENPFRAMAKMTKNSLGKLPAHLVIIFLCALTLTALCGIFLRFAEFRNSKNSIYLPERLSPEENAVPISESNLSGTWITAFGDYVVTLEIGNGVFETIVRYKKAPVSRYFIRGGYRMDGNVLILQERSDLGTPLDPDHLEYKFYPLSMKNINLYAQTDGKVMIWKTPSRERSRLDNPEPVVSALFGDRTEWVKAAALP